MRAGITSTPQRPELAGLRDRFLEELGRERLLWVVADALRGLDVGLDAAAVGASGAADRSYGIQVARLAGLPLSLNDRAKTILAKLEKRRYRRDALFRGPAGCAKEKNNGRAHRRFAADAAMGYSTVAKPSSFAAEIIRLSFVKIGPVTTES